MARPLRFLKFDGMHPKAYLQQKVDELGDELTGLDRVNYLNRILSFRSSLSDFYTYNLRELGWEAEEFLPHDQYYIEKVAQELFGSATGARKQKESLKNKVRPVPQRWEKLVVRSYIEHYKPDVIFVKESGPFESEFWNQFKDKALVVDRMNMNLPYSWSPSHFDIIITALEHFQAFFQSLDVPSYIVHDAFDTRILDEIKEGAKTFDVVHAGGLGHERFQEKTKFFEEVASKFELTWWGWGKEHIPPKSILHKVFQGPVSGLEMYQAYRNSKIVLNDYGPTAKGLGVNMRIYETMGVGTFLLTRRASNLEKLPKDLFVMYDDTADCLDKIEYFLKNELEREEIALAGHQYALEHFNYSKLMGQLSPILIEHWEKKFGGR